MSGTVEGTINVLERAHHAFTDPHSAPPPLNFESRGSAYLAYLWTGLESLRDWAGSTDREDVEKALEVTDPSGRGRSAPGAPAGRP